MKLANKLQDLVGISSDETGFQTPEDGFLPYACFYDPNTIITKNGELLQTIRIMGFSYELEEDQIEDLRNSIRKVIQKNISTPDFALWFHTIRSRRSLDPGGEYPTRFSYEAHDSWCKKNYWRDKYVNELYVTFVSQGENVDTNPVKNLPNFLRSFSFNMLKGFYDKKLDSSFFRLNQTVNNILVELSAYNARRLTIVKDDKDVYSEQLQFFGKIIQLEEKDMPLPVKDLSEYLKPQAVAFGHSSLQVLHKEEQGKSFFASIFTIKQYQEISAKAIDQFLQLPYQIVLTEAIDFTAHKTITDGFEKQDYMLKVSGDDELRQMMGLDRVITDNKQQTIDFGEHQITIMIIEDSQPRLKMAVKRASDRLGKLGLLASLEDICLEDNYWGQLPANFSFLKRQVPVGVVDIAAFASLNDFSAGHINNPWGRAVTIFRTLNGNPYFFNFHYHGSGHTAIIGRKGVGKTTTLNFLISEATKYKPRIFHFGDKSSKIFLNTYNAYYMDFSLEDTRNNPKLNPLMLPETEENKVFLQEWLWWMMNSSGHLVSDEDRVIIARIVNANYKFPEDQRRLSTLINAMLKSSDSVTYKTIIDRLEDWYGTGRNAWLFDNEKDEFQNRAVIGFNLGSLYNNNEILFPLVRYLIKRVNDLLDGSPSIVAFDNAWKIWKKSGMQEHFLNYLDFLKSRNALCIFATDNGTADKDEYMNQVLINKIPTTLILSNDPEHAKKPQILGLEKKIQQQLSEMSLLSRHFMIRHGNDRVVAELNLSGLDHILAVLSANDRFLKIFEGIIAQTGDDTNEWLPLYYQNAV